MRGSGRNLGRICQRTACKRSIDEGSAVKIKVEKGRRCVRFRARYDGKKVRSAETRGKLISFFGFETRLREM